MEQPETIQHVVKSLPCPARSVALQETSSTMDGTQLNDSTGDIPDFQAAKAAKNMLERIAGQEDGFV